MTGKREEGVSVEGAAATCEVMVEYPDANILLWLEAGGRAPGRSHLSRVVPVALKLYDTSKAEYLEESLFKT